jgi:flagellar biosynthesis/type III secretory pathway M-ring protein FliF/YscJ
MEVLLFVLFVLFSIGSSLLERRKRRKQQEQSREAQQQRPAIETPEQEESTLGWPFGDGDPLSGEVVPHQAEPEPTAQSLAEQQATEAERRALEVERHALASERYGQQVVVPQQRVKDLVRQHREAERSPNPATRRNVRVGRWHLDAQKARDAIVYAELLGPPKAEQDDMR